MNDVERDEEQQSLIHAHELINAQAEKIQQQAIVAAEQAGLMKRLEAKLMKLERIEEALKKPNIEASSEAFYDSDLDVNNRVGKKQKWLYDLGKPYKQWIC